MKRNRQKKKCSLLDYFFLSILEAGASAVAVVGLGLHKLINEKKTDDLW